MFAFFGNAKMEMCVWCLWVFNFFSFFATCYLIGDDIKTHSIMLLKFVGIFKMRGFWKYFKREKIRILVLCLKLSNPGVQARVPSPPVIGWANTIVSSFRHSAYYQHWPSSASIRVWEDICRSSTHNSFGDRSFSAAGPRVWKALPSYLRQDMNYCHFKHALKGHV